LKPLIYKIPVEPPPDSAPLAGEVLTYVSDGTMKPLVFVRRLQLENPVQAAA